MRTFLSSLVLAILAATVAVNADCSTSTSPRWKETAGNAGFPYVDSAIEITSQDTDSVTFSVAQNWIDPGTPMFAVHYRSASDEEEVCEMTANDDGTLVAYESSKSYTAECSHGYAEIGIYFYVGENDAFVAAECEACTAPDDDYVGHYVTVPCVYDPECEPSSAPSDAPTEDIDRTPDPPVDCVDSAKALLKETIGNDAAFPEYQPPITIKAQDLDSVTITVEQLFDENGVGMMAVGYRDAETEELDCQMEQPEVVFGFETTIEAKCEMGYAEVSVYLYTEADFDVTDSVACTIPNEAEYVAYHYIVPCMPICKPDVPDCFSGPLVQLADIHDEYDICIYEEMPVMLDQSGMTSGSVEFTLTNTWPEGDVTSVSVSYVDARTNKETCGTYGSEDAPFDIVEDLKAACDGQGMSTIVINVHGSGISYQSDQISSNTCSLPESGGTCGYEVVLPCDPLMVCGTTEKPSEAPTEAPTTYAPTMFPTHPPSWITADPTVSNAPTDCFEQPDPVLVDDVCLTTGGADMANPIAFPPGAVTVVTTADDAIAFEIAQNFADVAGLAVRTGLDDCTLTDQVAYGDSLEFEGECVNGVAAINVVVFLDPDFDATDCRACNVQDLTAMGGDEEFCAYRVEIPCETVPTDCGEPSAAPSGSFYPSAQPSETPTISSSPTASPTGSPSSGPTAGPTTSPSSSPTGSPSIGPTASPSSGPTASPSAGPTASPSSGPTASPSAGPTASPSSGPTASPSAGPTASPSSGPTTSPSASPSSSMAPTDCTGIVPPEVTSQICMDGTSDMAMVEFPPNAIVINSESGVSVDVTVTQEWEDAVAIALKHDDEDLSSSCTIAGDVAIGETFDFSSKCVNGMTTVTVVVYYGGFVEEECKACDVSDMSEMGGKFCAYNVEISCEPMPVDCGEPSASPSGSFYPSSMPSESPTISSSPTAAPTSSPSASPTGTPSASPSVGPTASPSSGPTASPSSGPTASPSSGPTASPSAGPTASPSSGPTASPSSGPTASPSASPSAGPTASPSSGPTDSPSSGPTASPSSAPSDTPTASPSTSMAPTDCTGSVPPEVTSGICMDGDIPMDLIGLPEGAITVLDEKGTSVDVLVTQKWGDDAIALAIKHENADLVTTCDIHEVDCEERFNLAARCIEGYTSITIVVYLGETFEESECKACDVEDISDMGGKFCAYNVQISCEPMSVECGEPSASPSGSFYPSSMPSESPTISSSPTASPTSSPSASPTGTPSASPSSGPTDSPSSGPTSSPSSGPTASPSSGPTASPSAGPTDSPSAGPTASPSSGPTASPSSGPTASPSSGPTASPSASPSSGPTASPSSGPTASPSSGPTDSPSSGPTASPSSGPTASPSSAPSDTPTASPSTSMAPTDCTGIEPPKVTSQICMDGDIPMDMIGLPEGAITVLDEKGTSVDVLVTQKWGDDAIALAIKHENADLVTTCDIHEVDCEERFNLAARCIEGYTSITIVVYLGETFEESECKACDVDDISLSGGKFCAYSIEVACEPMSVECGEPSASPSGSFYPSSMPSESPTISSSPSAAPTSSPSASPTGTPSASPSSGPTDSPSSGPTSSPSSGPTASPSSGPTASPSAGPTDSPSAGPTASPSAGPTASPSSGPTASPSSGPTASPSSGPTASPSSGPTASPSAGPTASPSSGPTASPSASPSAGPTASPSYGPTASPSASPSSGPTTSPSDSPTSDPTTSPSASPSGSFYPSSQPSESPTLSSAPSAEPTASPSAGPTDSPTSSPSAGPTASPSAGPTASPSAGPTASPSAGPTASPSAGPTDSPSSGPTASPSAGPTASPSSGPTASPSAGPTSSPSDGPTASPSAGPTASPSSGPTASPSAGPTATPSSGPTASPSSGPTASPSASPSDSPTLSPSVSMAPTDCSERVPPKVVSEICMDGDEQMDMIPFPEGAIVVKDEHGVSVDVTVTQEWGDDAIALAIKYEDLQFDSTCDIHEVNCKEKFNLAAECVEGMTSITIVVYLGETFEESECKACDVDDISLSGGKFCAYNIEVACEPMSVDCGEPSASPSGSFYPSSMPSESPTISSSPTASPTSSPSASPTGTPSASPSSGPTASPSSGPTSSPSSGPTASPSSGPTASPSAGPTASPSAGPTASPSSGPTASPSSGPTASPSSGPTASPSSGPTASPSSGPTASPSSGPTASPSAGPTASPSAGPTSSPSSGPTTSPSDSPTADPTTSPSASPSGSFYPSAQPSESPTLSSAPSAEPTASPSAGPTDSPTSSPSAGPTASPSAGPTASPSAGPTASPSAGPTASPSAGPTDSPSSGPTASPSAGPTASPSSGPTASPSAGPTASPSSGPTASPSAGPTASPSADPTVSMSPTYCTEYMPPSVIDSVCMTTGGEKMDTLPLPDGALTIGDVLDGKVGFTVTQDWVEEAGIAIQAGTDMCVVNGNVTIGDSEDMSATCTAGYAGITVVVFMDDAFDPNDCDACNVDDLSEMGGDYEFCAYRIEIPCEPVEVECGEPSASPSGSFYPSLDPTESPTVSMPPTDTPTKSPSESPTDSPSSSPTSGPSSPPTVAVDPVPPEPVCPERQAILIANEGETMYPDIPITITMQNVTHVGFQLENTFGQTVSSIFTQYHSGSFGETECIEEENVDQDTPIEFVAQCMRNTKISIVNVWMTDCNETESSFLDEILDNAEVPECCHPGDECKTVQYTFKIPCVDPCPPDEVTATEAPVNTRKLHEVDAHDLIRKKKAHDGSTKEFEDLTGHPEPNAAEDHFCVVEDYPCGPGLDKVHVCHYSARDGYKTFCVPEADSDALRFYPKDYCGPCVGGYAVA